MKFIVLLCYFVIKMPTWILMAVYPPFRRSYIKKFKDSISEHLITQALPNQLENPTKLFSDLIEDVFINKMEVPSKEWWDNEVIPVVAPEFCFDKGYMRLVIGQVWLDKIQGNLKTELHRRNHSERVNEEIFNHTMEYLITTYILTPQLDNLISSYIPKLSEIYNVQATDYNEDAFNWKINTFHDLQHFRAFQRMSSLHPESK